jgi:hypothetical protein
VEEEREEEEERRRGSWPKHRDLSLAANRSQPVDDAGNGGEPGDFTAAAHNDSG